MKVAVLTTARDEATRLGRFFSQLETMEKSFPSVQFHYSFYENDSVDATPSMLRAWIRGRKGSLTSETLGAPRYGAEASKTRGEHMAFYRNAALARLTPYSYDYLLVVDADVIWRPDHPAMLVGYLEEDKRAVMATANTVQHRRDSAAGAEVPSYYDSWALIAKDGRQGVSFAANPFTNPADCRCWAEGKAVEVKSAFGSMAVVRWRALVAADARWSGTRGCEHWDFCDRIGARGAIVACPWVMPRVEHEQDIPPDLRCLTAAGTALGESPAKQSLIHVVFRCTDKVFSVHASHRYFSDSKTEVAVRCFKSLTAALRGHREKVRITAIADSPSDALRSVILPSCDHVIEKSYADGKDAALDAFRIASECDGRWVFLVEDDYLFQPEAFDFLFEDLDAFGQGYGFREYRHVVLHPTDYSDRYTREGDTLRKGHILRPTRAHYRQIYSTTMTVMMRRETLAQVVADVVPELKTWKVDQGIDAVLNVFYEREDVLCVSPIPSFAFHLNGCNSPAPLIDWRKVWDSSSSVQEGGAIRKSEGASGISGGFSVDGWL